MKYRINYSKVIAQAQTISNQADQLSAQIQQLAQVEQTCGTVWKGQAAEAFVSQLRLLRDEMNRTRRQIANLAATIRYCADRIQQEDQEAQRRAAELNTNT